MSNRPTANADRSTGTVHSAASSVASAFESVGRDSVVRGGGVVAFVAVAAATLLRLLHNLPFDPVATPALRAVVDLLSPLAVAAALVAVAVATTRASVRVGFLFAGVFGALVAASPAATLPGVVAVTVGGGVALFGAVGRPTCYREVRTAVVAAALVTAVAVSLASASGLVGGQFRHLGALVACLALVGSAVRTEGDPLAFAAGAVTFVAALAASTANPFVAGSVLLVGFGVVGVPLALPALAAGAAVAVAIAGLRRGDVTVVAGIGLLAFAGVPATVPRATAVVLGATLLFADVPALTAPDREVTV